MQCESQCIACMHNTISSDLSGPRESYKARKSSMTCPSSLWVSSNIPCFWSRSARRSGDRRSSVHAFCYVPTAQSWNQERVRIYTGSTSVFPKTHVGLWAAAARTLQEFMGSYSLCCGLPSRRHSAVLGARLMMACASFSRISAPAN